VYRLTIVFVSRWKYVKEVTQDPCCSFVWSIVQLLRNLSSLTPAIWRWHTSILHLQKRHHCLTFYLNLNYWLCCHTIVYLPSILLNSLKSLRRFPPFQNTKHLQFSFSRPPSNKRTHQIPRCPIWSALHIEVIIIIPWLHDVCP